MFCEKCGANNEKKAKFCEKCGAAMPKTAKKVEFKITKKMGIIIASIIVALIVLTGGFLFVKNSLSPEREAIKYFEAVMNQDADKLYGYMDVENSGLTSKKVFKEIASIDKDEKEELVNYKVSKTDKIGELYLTVTIEYVTKDSTRTKEARVNFVKEKKKKYLLFDNWTIQTSETRIIEDTQLKVLKDSKVVVSGVELGKGDINKKDSTESFDVYDLPDMFSTKYPVKVSLPIGFDMETTITPSTYTKVITISVTEDDLTSKSKKELETAIKNNLKTIYESAIANKSFEDIKSNFEHKNIELKDLEKSYTSFEKSISGQARKLTDIKFDEIEIRDLDITKDGQLEIYFAANCDYTIKYKSGSEEKEKTDDNDVYAYMNFNYDNGYKIVDFRSLNYYFY